MTTTEQADAFFADGYNCAQAVLAAFGPEYGLSLEQCMKIAGPFGGGIARTGETCGVVSGALLALGMACADPTPAGKAANYALAQDFLARFTARHGTLRCKALLGCDISTPEGQAEAKARDLHHTTCAGLVHDAAALLEALLAEQGGGR